MNLNDLIIQLYKNGHTLQEIATKVGFSAPGIAYRLKRLGIVLKSAKARTETKRGKAVKYIRDRLLERTGVTCRQLALELGLSRRTVVKYRKEVTKTMFSGGRETEFSTTTLKNRKAKDI